VGARLHEMTARSATRRGGGRDSDLLSVSEAARLLRLQKATVRQWVHDDLVASVPTAEGLCSRHRIPMNELLGSLDGLYDLRSAKVDEGRRMRAAKLAED
jgi:excisionase family DNA binding protein